MPTENDFPCTGEGLMGITKSIIIGIAAAGLGLGQAQTYKVNLKGNILDSRSGVAISGANISLAKNPTIKGTSDAQGNFTLSGEVVGIAALNGVPEKAMTW